MMEPQGQAPAPAPVAPKVIHVEGLGFIPLTEGQTVQQAIAAARGGQAKRQADPSSLGLRGGAPEQFVGVEAPEDGWMDALPPHVRESIGQAIQAFPQLAAFGAQLMPQARAARTAVGMTVPPAVQAITNLLGGKPWDEGVGEEMMLGAATSFPGAAGTVASARGVKHAREALATSPRIAGLAEEHGKDFVEHALPLRALETQARATVDGVGEVVERAANMRGEAMDLSKEAKTLLSGIPNPSASERALQASTAGRARQASDAADLEHSLGNVLEDLRYQFSMHGAKGGPTAIAPGSGAVTTAVRAAGLPPGVGQVAAPAAGFFKGSPVRKLHAASRMYSPFGVQSEEFGNILSQLARLWAADSQAGTGIVPAVSHALTPAADRPKPRRRAPR